MSGPIHRGDRSVPADPGRPGTNTRLEPPRHPDLREQPGQRQIVRITLRHTDHQSARSSPGYPRPKAIEAVLVDLLADPCAQDAENGRRPLLLIIDRQRRLLHHDPAHRVPGYPRTLGGPPL
jgi:hypothetical protein